MSKRSLALIVIFSFCFAATVLAAPKKIDKSYDRPTGRSDDSLQNGTLADLGSGASGGTLTLGRSGSGGPLISCPCPPAQDCWCGGNGNFFSGNWSAGIPGALSNVTIYSGMTDNVSLSTSVPVLTGVYSLQVGGPSNGYNSTLEIEGSLTHVEVENALNVGENGYLEVTNASHVLVGADTSNAGQIALTGGSMGTFYGALTNNMGAQVDLENASTLNITGDVTNSGTLSTSGSGNTLNINGMLTNSGTFQLDGRYENPGGTGDTAMIASLTNNAGGVVDVEGGSTLTITGAVTNDAGADIYTDHNYQVGGNTIKIGGTLTNDGTINIEGQPGNSSALQVTGEVDNSGSIYLSPLHGAGNTITVGGMLTNSGTFDLYGPGDIATVESGGMNNSGNVDVEQRSTLNITGDVINSGTIQTNLEGYGGGSTISIGGALTNSGVMRIQSAGDMLNITGDVANNSGATIALTGGSGMFEAGLTNNSGATVDLENASSLTIDGNVTNSGILSANATLGSGGNSLNVTGMLTNSGGVLVGSAAGDNDNATIGGLANSEGGFVDVEGGSKLTITDVTNSSGSAIYTSYNGTGGNTIDITGTLTNGGTIGIESARDTLTVTGEVTNNSGATIALTGGSGMFEAGLTNNSGATVDLENASTLTIDVGVTNRGALTTSGSSGSGGNNLTINGMLTNDVGAVFQVGSSGIAGGDKATIGSLTNNSGGFVDVEGGSTLMVQGNVTNAGSLNAGYDKSVGGNTLEITGMLTNSGTFTLGRTGQGDGMIENGVDNTGTIDVEGGGSTLQITGQVDNSGSIYISPDHFASNTITISEMLTNSGTFDLYGPMDVATVRSGGMNNSGNIDVEQGSTLNITGDVTNSGTIQTNLNNYGGGNTITISGELTNGGTFQLAGYSSPGGAGDNATIGALQNMQGGVINVEGDSTLTIDGAATNDGSISLSPQHGSSNKIIISDMLTNAGTFDLYGPRDSATVQSGGVINSGNIDVEQSSTLNITGDVTNSGTIQTNLNNYGGGNTISITGTLTNSGTFQLNGQPSGPGDSAKIGFVTNNAGGFIDVEGNSSLTVTVGVENFSGGGGANGIFTSYNGSGHNAISIATMENFGTFELNGPVDMATLGSLLNAPGSFVGQPGSVGFIDVENGSTLNVRGTLSNDYAVGVGGSIYTSYNGTGNNTINVGGQLENGGMIGIEAPGDKLEVTGVVDNTGLIAFNFFTTGFFQNDFDNEASGTVSLGNPATESPVNGGIGYDLGGNNNVTIGWVLTNSGTFQLNGPSDLATIGGVTNNSGGFIDVEGASTLNILGNTNNSGDMYTTFYNYYGGGNTINIGGVLTNSGTFQMLGSGDMATIASLTNNAGGVVGVDNGSTMTITGDVNNSGTLSTNANSLYAYNTLSIGGILTNGGTLQINGPDGDVVTVNYSVNNSGTIDLNNYGYLGIGGDLNNSGSTYVDVGSGGGDSALIVNGNLNNTGTLQLASFDYAGIGGAATNAAGATIDVENGSTLAVTGNVTNSGTLETDANGYGGGNTITVGGLLTNTPSGIISLNGSMDMLQALAGITNSGTINANNGSSIDPPFFNNLGTLNIDSTSAFVVGNGAHAGTGYIQLANGILGEMIGSTGFGVINVNGSALLNGTLEILLQNGFDPTIGSTYKFILTSANGVNGVFSTIEDDIFDGGAEKWGIDYDSADGYVELIAEQNQTPLPEPGVLLTLIPGVLGAGFLFRRQLLR